MFRIFEQYLEQLGERRGMLLLAAVLVWVSIFLAIFAYGVGMGLFAAWRISVNAYEAIAAIVTEAPLGGDPWAIVLGAVVWMLLLLLFFPLRAARKVWHRYQRQNKAAQVALTEIEIELFAANRRSSNVHNPTERLARRALDQIETDIVGEPQPADLTIEERLIKLRE